MEDIVAEKDGQLDLLKEKTSMGLCYGSEARYVVELQDKVKSLTLEK